MKVLKSEDILPKEKRIEEYYSDDTDVECLDDWEYKYGDFKTAVYLIDDYHRALKSAENEVLYLKTSKSYLRQTKKSNTDKLTEQISQLFIENQGLKLAIERGHGGNCMV